MTPPRLGAVAAFAVLLLDQASKVWAVAALDGETRPAIPLMPFLDLVLARNHGISYSLFRAEGVAGRLALIGVALAALVVITVWLWRSRSMLTALGLGLVAGGAAGNVIDRIRTGAVIDFLYFHTPVFLGPLSNYVFNLADAAIFVGVCVLLYESIIAGRSSQTAAAPGEVPTICRDGGASQAAKERIGRGNP